MKKWALLTLSSLALAACGSGGSGGAGNSTENTSTSITPTASSTQPVSCTSSFCHVDAAWKAQVRAAKEIRLNNQIFNLADENIGWLTQSLDNAGTVFKGYNQIYSSAYMISTANGANELHVVGVKSDAPLTGTATYQGVAFGADSEGKLNLNVDFANKTVSGNITNRQQLSTQNGLSDIVLNSGTLNNQGAFTGSTNVGTYIGQLYGKDAQEVAGELKNSSNNTTEVFIGSQQ